MKKRYKIIIGVILVAILVSPHIDYSFESSVETLDHEHLTALDGEHDESDHVYENNDDSGNVTYHIRVEAAIKAKQAAEKEELEQNES